MSRASIFERFFRVGIVRTARALTLLFALALTACPSSNPLDAGPVTDAASDLGETDASRDATVPPELATFTHDTAVAICAALFRCCPSPSDLAAYFAPYRASTDLVAFTDRLPPAATLDATSCPDLVHAMLDVVPFGDWVREANDRAVTFDPVAAASCRDALTNAQCGRPVWNALFDTHCFGFAGPAVIDRAMFHRTRTVGEACRALRDGASGLEYGTCDPTRAYCCFRDPTRSDDLCIPALDETATTIRGTCLPAGALGDGCSRRPPRSECRAGFICVGGTPAAPGVCTEGDRTAPLELGAPCIDANGARLGVCTGGECDALGSRTCEIARADGTACSVDEECASGACECPASGGCYAAGSDGGPEGAGQCVAWSLCVAH